MPSTSEWLRTVRSRAGSVSFDIAAVGVAVAFLLGFTLPHLSDFPVPIDDEIWILSASHKLATESVFGTDLFAGFYRADDVYMFNMPAHHFVLAGAFELFGTSIFVGRLVSVLYGVAALALVYVIGLKLGGRQVAIIAVAMMLLLRLVVGIETGLPLQESARSIRYDLAPVPFMLGAFILLLQPTFLRVGLAGALLALATLFQFYAAFMFPIAGVYLLLESESLRAKLRSIAAMGVVAAVVLLPYGVYVGTNYEAFEGQTSTLERRNNFTDPAFYLDNLERESKRFPFNWHDVSTALFERPSAKASVLIGLPAAALFAGWTAFRTGRRDYRLLALTIAGLPMLFALLEAQKIYYYWISVFPFLCLGLANLNVWGMGQLRAVSLSQPLALRNLQRLAIGGAAGVFLFAVAFEGSYAQVQGIRVWDTNTEYLSLRDRLGQHVPPGSRVVGATSLWWALPETEFRSYYMLFYRTNPRIADRLTTISGYLDETQCEYVVLNRTSRYFLSRLIQRDKEDLEGYLKSSAERVSVFEDASYGYIEVWKVDRSKRPPPPPIQASTHRR